MESEVPFDLQVKRLVSRVYVAGQEIRVKHGNPECFPAINDLCNKFLSEDIPSNTQTKIEPINRFRLCIDHVYN